MRKIGFILVSILLLVGATLPIGGCGGGGQVTVGGKNFTEQYLIVEMMAQLLEDRGYTVDRQTDLQSQTLRNALESGEIDICADYTGTAYLFYMNRQLEPGTDNNALYETVKELDAAEGLIWLDPIWNNNTYAFACWPDWAQENGIETLSDLATFYRETDGKGAVMFVDFEFASRPDGMPGIMEFYDFEIADSHLRTGQVGISIQSLATHQCDVTMVFGTDPAIAEYGWYAIIDDQGFFPPYDLTPIVREDTLSEYPEIESILNELVATFPGGGEPATPEIVSECQQLWSELNGKVELEGMDPEDVAHDYLVEHGLIS